MSHYLTFIKSYKYVNSPIKSKKVCTLRTATRQPNLSALTPRYGWIQARYHHHKRQGILPVNKSHLHRKKVQICLHIVLLDIRRKVDHQERMV